MINLDPTLIPFKKGIYLVGGSLRDALLARKPLDYDIVVRDDPLSYAREIEKSGEARIVPMGKPGREIIRVIRKNVTLDISILQGASIEEDLQHRDFTINAMAYEPFSNELIDIFGGLNDLKKQRIRMVSPSIFNIDPLRLLRAYRLAASLGFAIDPETVSCIRKNARFIRRAAGERIRDELFKILFLPHACTFIIRMTETGLLLELLPELEALKKCAPNRHHAFDGLKHTLTALDALENIFSNLNAFFPENSSLLSHRFTPYRQAELKFAILLHDIGKPVSSQQTALGDLRFPGHEETGAVMATDIACRLRFSVRETDDIAFVIRHHLRPLFLFTASRNGTLSPRSSARFFLKCGAYAPDILLHAAADMQAKKVGMANDNSKIFLAFTRDMLHEYYARILPMQSEKPLISGRDLIQQLNLQPSPLFKTILSRVAEAHLAGQIAQKEEALSLARNIARGN